MQDLFYLFHPECIVFQLWNYQMSFLELIATFTNLIAVWLSTKEKVSSWYIGIVAVSLYFVFFYQNRLYADSFLQVFFFVTNCIGWYQWTHPKIGYENQQQELIVTHINLSIRFVAVVGILFGTFMMGRIFTHIHDYIPTYFPEPAAFPFADSFIMVASIVAQILLMRKKIETWYVWIIVNITAVIIYAQKGIFLTSILFFVFLILAILGLFSWQKSLKSAK